MAVANPVLSNEAFERAAREGADRAAMTVGGTYLITGFLLALLAVAAVFGWGQVDLVAVPSSGRVGGQRVVPVAPDWVGLLTLLTFVVAMVTAFNPRAAIITGPLYAIGQGVVLGVASRYYDATYDGIVLQAVLATLSVFLVMLMLYAMRIVKVTPRFAMVVIAATGGLAVLYAVLWLLSLFGVNVAFLNSPTPVGIALSVGIVILGALNLPLNFDFIERTAAAGAPQYLQWYGAYGLMLSLIWLYVSILRVLALLRGRD
jgi:uncharacterized YccA/Bax inhibitor family protein